MPRKRGNSAWSTRWPPTQNSGRGWSHKNWRTLPQRRCVAGYGSYRRRAGRTGRAGAPLPGGFATKYLIVKILTKACRPFEKSGRRIGLPCWPLDRVFGEEVVLLAVVDVLYFY